MIIVPFEKAGIKSKLNKWKRIKFMLDIKKKCTANNEVYFKKSLFY